LGSENVPTNVLSMITYYVILLLYFSSRKQVISKHESLVFHYSHVFGGHPFKRRILIISPCCGVYVVLFLVLCVVVGESLFVCLFGHGITCFSIYGFWLPNCYHPNINKFSIHSSLESKFNHIYFTCRVVVTVIIW
jgi:hypothetical protein